MTKTKCKKNSSNILHFKKSKLTSQKDGYGAELIRIGNEFIFILIILEATNMPK